jgi:hypothetical protein
MTDLTKELQRLELIESKYAELWFANEPEKYVNLVVALWTIRREMREDVTVSGGRPRIEDFAELKRRMDRILERPTPPPAEPEMPFPDRRGKSWVSTGCPQLENCLCAGTIHREDGFVVHPAEPKIVVDGEPVPQFTGPISPLKCSHCGKDVSDGTGDSPVLRGTMGRVFCGDCPAAAAKDREHESFCKCPICHPRPPEDK